MAKKAASKRDDSEKISKYFTRDEFACRCCGSVGTNPAGTKKVLALADAMREELGVPIHCNSGFRCKKHNKEVGGVPDSEHTKGTAMDLAAPPGVSVDRMGNIARHLGAGGVGVYHTKRFVHVDVGERRDWSE